MDGDLLVRGGTVVDGTGAPSVRADVRVRGGVIAEVGPGLRPDGEAELDASGALVTPGLIESHTHFDGALWWDAACDPMPAYGVTTVVLGNCGLTLAPLRPETRDGIVDLFCFIEDLPVDAFREHIPFGWETWPEYRRSASAYATSVNAAGYIGQQSLRTFVMGDEAWERVATADERHAMAVILDEALGAGALGLSTSYMDTDRDNRDVPSRVADDVELGALLDVIARHPSATFQFVPRFLQPEHFHADIERVAELCAPRGVRGVWGGFGTEVDRAEQRAATLAHLDEMQRRGAMLAPLYSSRPQHVNLHFDRSIMWSGVPAWHELVNGQDDRKAVLLRDEAWRARARSDWDACTYTLVPIRRPEALLLSHAERPGRDDSARTLAELARVTRVHLSDALADWLLAHGIRSSLRTAHRPVDDDAVASLARRPDTVAGASDAGAHIQMFSGAGESTYFLTHLVRETGLLRIEEAVHALTGKHATFFGLTDRGVVAPGMAADLAVFELDRLVMGDEVRTDDIPAAGAWRYTRPPAHFRATVVAGVPTCVEDRITAARPATFLQRSSPN
jgi:N-acyl-D-amino-acid deacylase